MQIVRELEADARGIYTGCIGYLAPGRKARFNVAIRTVSDRSGGRGRPNTAWAAASSGTRPRLKNTRNAA